MTVPTTETRVAYSGDGVTTAFAVTFPFYEATDLEVIEREIATGIETVKALNSAYSVGGGDGATGTVTALVAPASSVQWVIRRKTPLTQLIDYAPNDGFPADSHEQALDRAAMRDQELVEELGRALKFAKTDTVGSTILPTSTARANKFLKFDANGNPIAAIDVELGPTLSLPVSIANGGSGATTASAARTALGAAGTGDANSFTQVQTATLASAGAAPIIAACTDPGASEGPIMLARRDSASPAANDYIGAFSLQGKDSGGNWTDYARIRGQILDPTDGSEDATMAFITAVAGAVAERMKIGAGLVVGSPTGGDPGAGKINASDYQKDGVPLLSGTLVQFVSTQTGAASTTSTVIPQDDTIPQSTEGAQVMSLAITPKSASNRLKIEVVVNADTDTSGAVVIAALFKDSDAGALAAAMDDPYDIAGSGAHQIVFTHVMTAGTTSAITFKVRAGPGAAATLTFNGFQGVRKLGGVMASSISITEIAA